MRVLTIQLTLSIRALIESMKNTQKILASLLLSSLCIGASAANITSVNFGMGGNITPAMLKSLRLEMINANGDVYETYSQNAPFSTTAAGYIGLPHNHDLKATATAATQFRVGFELF